MSLMILAAMMMAQAPSAAEPAVTSAAPAATAAVKKQKTKQVCEYVEVTGSRSKRRVCRDDSGSLDLGPGVHSGSYGQDSGTQSAASPGGSN